VTSKSRGSSRKRSSRVPIAHETDLSRRQGTRQQRKSILIVTNGERTERDYFEGVRREPWVEVALRVRFSSGDPTAVVVRAATLRDDYDYDHVWAVCDVDQFNVEPAIADATARGVGLALSNPCFEVWLILHQRPGCPRLSAASQAGKVLGKHIATWDKTRLNFADFREHIFAAIERAQVLGEPPAANPSTSVWRVIEAVRAHLPSGRPWWSPRHAAGAHRPRHPPAPPGRATLWLLTRIDGACGSAHDQH
jgi:hypothetical protein